MIRTAPELVTAPATPLVSLADAKAFLRIDDSDSNTLIEGLVSAATAHLDGWRGVTGMVLITQDWRERLPWFPYRIDLRLRPVQSIVSITYIDSAGASQTVSSSTYRLHQTAAGAYVVPVDGASWPSAATRDDAVTVTYRCGFGDEPGDVDPGIVTAAKLLVAHWFDRRGVVADSAAEMPLGVQAILARFRPAYSPAIA